MPSGTGENEPVIRLIGVSRRFDGTPPGTLPALDTLSADIPSGQVVGLVGPDAAGKTTLMRLLAGLLLPSSGEILVWGRAPDATGEADEQNNVGYMPQRFGLYEDLSVIDNLNLHAELRGLRGSARSAMFEKLLTFTDLKPFTQRLAGKLSGGMKQKLGLACALLTTPRLLLLDEPGVGVDPLSRRELWRMVSGLAGDGMSVLWSTAYMDEAERCSHVLMLDQGRLVYQGPPDAFMQRVKGRVFCLVPQAGEARATLALWQQQPGVRDALIQGSRIRLVLESADTSRLPADPRLAVPSLFSVPPRLEDAYIDAVGGINPLPSPFTGKAEAFPSPQYESLGKGWDAGRTGRYGRREREPVRVSPALQKGSFPRFSLSPSPSLSLSLSPSPSLSLSLSPSPSPLIRAEGLTKQFGAFVAARDISFEVLPGQIFGLLGPNGAGKSTTFRMLCGLSRPTKGACFVAGMNLLTAAGAARARLGYMAQKFSLYGELTVLQNMQLMADLYDLPREQVRGRMDELVETLDLTAYRTVKANLLPLGHKQRLAMACATLHNPPVLFLDEPTSGVDPRTRREFWKHISAMTGNGVAVLVTTHFMEEAEYCDEIALVFQGAIIARGTPDELKAQSPVSSEVVHPENITLEEAFIAYIEHVHQTEAASHDVTGGGA